MTQTIAAPPVPPLADKRPESKTIHGVTLVDDYAWLKAANWQEVLRDPSALPADIRRVIDEENQYAQTVLAPTKELRERLIKEMRGRIKEDDAEVPVKDGDFLYYARHVTGGQHPLFCRTDLSGKDETVLLDGEKEGHDKTFFDLGMVRHSPDHRLVAWSVDEKGSELYSIKVRDPATGLDRSDLVLNTDGTIVWLSDSSGFYYVRVDANHRTAQVFRHLLGHDSASDELVFEELDPAWFVHIHRSQSAAFAIISVSDHDSAECHLLDLADPQAKPRLIEKRSPGLRYDVEDHGDQVLIRTNADGAEDFKIVTAPLASPAKASWADFIPHSAGRMIIAFVLFRNYLIWLERENGLPNLKIHNFVSNATTTINFPEEAYHLSLADHYEYDTAILRFIYSSMTTPREVYDYDLATHQRVLRKRQILPSGHEPADYVTRRLFAPAADGEIIPVSILYHKETKLDGSAPVLLYGYGAYGHPTSASFSASRLSLVDRGFIFAIAHIRGGTDKGWHWYTDGKLARKPNTFSDFVAAGRHLVSEGLTREGRIVAQGGSAGGMLMGAVVNLAPELFAGIIADVPFVDVMNTMLDADLPLTPPEWLEWGNPILDPEAFATILSYSPYDNVTAKRYPPILALGGLTDPRVTYWEPAKWVARLRATMTGGGPILLMTNMGAGHGGASGRFDRLGEVAIQYAFALACIAPGFASPAQTPSA